jgi:hypothetical protein
MELLGDVGHVESCLGPFRDGIVSVQDRCTACAKHTTGSKQFWMHPMVLLGDEALVKAHFSPFADSANIGAR